MRQTILLIDDSLAMHELVRTLLDEKTIVIDSAFDGEAGIELAVELKPDLILLDVDMPGCDGFEVCRRLKEDVRTAGISIIFLTAMNESQEKVRGLDLGGNDYITKPFDPPEFAARIRALLRTKTRVDSIRSKRVNDFIRRSLQAVGGADRE